MVQAQSVRRVLDLVRSSRWTLALQAWRKVGPVRQQDASLVEIGAVIHEQLGQAAEAAALWRRLCELRPDDPAVVASCADLLLRSGAADEACERLLAFVLPRRGRYPVLEGHAARLSADRAARLEAVGDLPGARAAAETACALDPAHLAAGRVLVRLDHQEGRLVEARDRALALCELPASDAERSSVCLELAVVRRRLGELDAAFESARRGKELAVRRYLAEGYDLGGFTRSVERIRGWRSSAPPAPARTSDRRAPVWMVGFPRSGTTLTQQILQSHPAVQTLDEKDPAMAVLRRHLGDRGSPYPECLDALGPDDWQALRAEYFRVIDGLGLPAHDLLVDKLPLNLVRLDYLVRLFPDSRVLVSLRDPRDCVLSNFFQDYEPNPAMVCLARLDDIAALYAASFALWLEQRPTLPVPWREQRYEDLAEDLAGEAAALLEFLGVPWDDAVLAHHRAVGRGPISTPSRYDVAKPVYRTAVGRWRGFQAHLAPVLPVLEPFARAFGYEGA